MRHKFDTQPSAPTTPPVEKPPAKVVKSIVKNSNSKLKSKKVVSKENLSKASKENTTSSTGTVLPTSSMPVSLPTETPVIVHQESCAVKVSIYSYCRGTEQVLVITKTEILLLSLISRILVNYSKPVYIYVRNLADQTQTKFKKITHFIKYQQIYYSI